MIGMMKNIILISVAFMLTIACKEEKKFGKPQPLDHISLKGQQYEGEVLKNKLTKQHCLTVLNTLRQIMTR